MRILQIALFTLLVPLLVAAAGCGDKKIEVVPSYERSMGAQETGDMSIDFN